MAHKLIYRLCLFSPLLWIGALYSQESISADVVSTMRVCGKNSVEGAACATAPQALSKSNPVYPEKARKHRKEGTVTLGLTVRQDGSAADVRVVKGVDKEIDRAAVDAVRQWKFTPGTYQGKAVNVALVVTVNFRLSSDSQQLLQGGAPPAGQGSADEFRNLYSNAVEAYNRGDFVTTANLLRKATSINPQSGSAWNELGRALMATNELDAAVPAFRKAIEKDPGTRDAYNNLGLVYWRQRKYEEAEVQFRKQMVVNPDDHYAHRNLGMMLRNEHKCGEAMPELQKALSLTPNFAGALLAEGECDLDLGNRAKGISELEQATGASPAPGTFNSAAYILAKRDVEIGMAEKWSETSLTIVKARLQNVSLDHLTPEQLNYASWIASYWDTRGWIYFLQGDEKTARSYVEAAWSLRAVPSMGYHLGRIYEKSGRVDDAAKAYAMAIASADESPQAVDMDDLADARRQLAKLGDKNGGRVKQGSADLNAKGMLLISNEGAVSGSADFAVRLSSNGKPVEFHQLNGDAALAKFADTLQAAKLPVFLPESSGVEVAVRGALTCHSEESQCRFLFLRPEEAVNLARSEMALASTTPSISATHDPHVYDDPALGIRISVPDEWRVMRTEPGTFSQPRNVMFGKSGSAAMFMLTRERFEGSADLYEKTLERFFSTKTNFKRVGQEAVKRDGLTGTRWSINFDDGAIPYSAVIEMFSMGDDHYRIMTLAPKETYGRYVETFENLLRSVQFPMLRVDPHILDPAK